MLIRNGGGLYRSMGDRSDGDADERRMEKKGRAIEFKFKGKTDCEMRQNNPNVTKWPNQCCL